MLNGNIYTHLDVTNTLREQEKAIDNGVNKERYVTFSK